MTRPVPQRAFAHSTYNDAETGDVVLVFVIDGERKALVIDDVALNFLAHLLPREVWRREEAESLRVIQRIENGDHSESVAGNPSVSISPQEGLSQLPSDAATAASEGEI